MYYRREKQWIVHGFRWLARVWSMALLALAVIESANPTIERPVSWQEWLIPILLFSGVLAGFLLSWRWEGGGGACFILGWFASQAWSCVTRGACISAQALVLNALTFVTPGILFIVCWSLSHIWEEVDQDLYPPLYGY